MYLILRLLNSNRKPRGAPIPPARPAASSIWFILLAVLALLVCNRAGGLASGLAGSLALAATAVCRRLLERSGSQSLNVFHVVLSPLKLFSTMFAATATCTRQRSHAGEHQRNTAAQQYPA